MQERDFPLRNFGTFEAAIWICGIQAKYSANESFLNLVASANPHYTGWPFWVDSRHFADEVSRPYVSDGNWEAFILRNTGDSRDKVDFWHIEPGDGLFFHCRGLEDDINASRHSHQPCSVLDWVLVLNHVAEVIGTGLAFARGMGITPPLGTVGFAFRWTRLKGRVLESWSTPTRDLISNGAARTETVFSKTIIPPDTTETAIFGHVHEVTKGLFEAFGGKELQKHLVSDVVSRLFNRNM
jgi:hypothetical protein